MTRTGPRLAAVAAFVVFTAACGSSSGGTVATDVGITSNQILLGNTISQTGAAAAYGTIANAENAYFTYINSKGGINGRKIKFVILDDAYNPAQTVPLTKQLVEQNQVFAMFSGLGTQDQTSVRDYLKGLIDGLGDKASTMIVDKESYDVTSASPASQLAILHAKGADTVFVFAIPKPTIESLAIITGLHWAPTLYVNAG